MKRHLFRRMGRFLRPQAPSLAGAAALAALSGLLALLMTSPELAQTREQLGLDAHSRVLLVSTEGDTDPQQYLDIVWGGQYPGIK